MDRPTRKPMRLKGHDYSTPGAYFITICTRDKRCILSSIENPPGEAVGAATSRPPNKAASVLLTAIGEIVDLAIRNMQAAYPTVSVEKYVIMPNHVHLLLRIGAGDDGRMISAPTINTVVGQMKRWASRQAGHALWQKSFYDHIVRNEDDYRRTAEYIDANPARWAEDRFYGK